MGILTELSSKLEERAVKENVVQAVSSEANIAAAELDMYRGLKDSNIPFNVAFANITPNGEFYVSVGNTDKLYIHMRQADASRWVGTEFDASKSANTLGKEISVNVTDIDEEKGIIYVKAVQRDTTEERNQIRDSVNEELNKLFNEANKNNVSMCIKVNAAVVGVYEHYVILNIARAGVMARVSIANWAKYYVRNLASVCKRGDVYKINITGKMRMRKIRGIETWEAEHASFTVDPWQEIDTEHVGVRSTVTVECVDVDYAMNRWWGHPVDSRVLPEHLELLGNMKSGENAVRPIIGKRYQCNIARMDIENRKLIIVPFREILPDRNQFGVLGLPDEKKEADDEAEE